jgi:uncharacterized protein YmfQ (DUF2313 family)
MNASADGVWTADSDITADADAPAEPTFSAAQYSQAARNLLPPGRAWNRQDGSNQAFLCDALGDVYEEQDADSVQLLADFFPPTATQGIPEWNSTLGLPDPCSGAPASQGANQNQIVAKLIATGGQSIPYYEALAEALGYEISISEFSPTVQGDDAPAGLITKAQDWAYTWRVNVISGPASLLALYCLLTRYRPAHTQFYVVTGASPPLTDRLFNSGDNVSEALLIQQ